MARREGEGAATDVCEPATLAPTPHFTYGVLDDVAVLSGLGGSPTGFVTFGLIDPSNLTVFTDQLMVSGFGTCTSGSNTPLVSDTYSWYANCGGNPLSASHLQALPIWRP